jgi:glycosyltransferase involved in cell wall biosynthesis
VKVLQVVEPGVDGVFRHVEGLIEFLISKGVDTSIAYSDVRGSKGLYQLVGAVEASGGTTLNLRVGNSPSSADVRAWSKLRALIAELRPDVLHAHSSKAGGLTRLPFLGGQALTKLYTPHAYYGMARRGGLRQWVFDRIERGLGPHATTINISEEEAEFARSQLGIRSNQQRVIHNPVQTQRFLPATTERRAAARASFGIHGETFVLGTVGRMCFQKDPETLYRAIAPVLVRTPNARLLHLGEGELFTELKQLSVELGIQQQLVFPGYMEDTRRFYDALDGLVMTSRYEAGWPIVILEALSCDLPIVCSLGPGMGNLAGAGLSHCWTAPVGNIEHFTRAIEALLQDLPTARPSNHRAVALARFSPESCYGAVLGLYESLSGVRSCALP